MFLHIFILIKNYYLKLCTKLKYVGEQFGSEMKETLKKKAKNVI